MTTVRFRGERRHAGSEFATQLMGQDGQRRGLRAGATLIEQANHAYNTTEWSGRYDRRAPRGAFAREDI